MEFKHSKINFGVKNRFGDDMKGFICDEAARFTTDSNEAASASMDEMIEKTVRFSAEKNKQRVEIQEEILSDIQEKQETLSLEKDPSINPSKQEKVEGDSYSLDTDVEDSYSKSDTTDSLKTEKRETQKKELNQKQDKVKKEKAKEKKKIGAKTAVASMFKMKKDMSNDLVGEKVTGDALKDGLSGAMQTLIEFISPIRWIKGLVAKFAMMLVPYIAIFMMIVTVLIIVIMLLFSILQPLADVGAAIDNFLSIFTEESDTFTNKAFTESEIDEIVATSNCDETQEKVIRYALEKVGYPYSQEDRTSGSAYDCSSLVYYCWENAGVDISYGSGYPPTAASGASMLNEDNKTLDMMELKAGDIIYYGGADNGRYLGIYHVAIYIGDGKAVEALNTKYGVVYQTLKAEKAIMVCRPNK